MSKKKVIFWKNPPKKSSRDFENVSRAVPRDSTGSRGIGLPIWNTSPRLSFSANLPSLVASL